MKKYKMLAVSEQVSWSNFSHIYAKLIAFCRSLELIIHQSPDQYIYSF